MHRVDRNVSDGSIRRRRRMPPWATVNVTCAAAAAKKAHHEMRVVRTLFSWTTLLLLLLRTLSFLDSSTITTSAFTVPQRSSSQGIRRVSTRMLQPTTILLRKNQFFYAPSPRRWFHATLDDEATLHPSLAPYIRDMDRVLQNHIQLRRIRESETPDPMPFDNDDDTSSTQFRLWCNEQRRQKPSLLLNDLDGAEKCGHMLRHLQQSLHPIPESVYQRVMKVFLFRGRLRWRRHEASSSGSSNSSSNLVICAADQLEELLQDLEEHSSEASPVSVSTYNMVLEAYANCATPRGDRQYAQRAHVLLQRMERIQNVTSSNATVRLPVESYLHVLHAYAWQQGNLQSSTDAADEAHRLLDTVLQSTTDPLIHMQATIWVLEAYSKSTGGARHCHALLQNVLQYNRTLTDAGRGADARLLCDAEVYSNAILAWSKAAADPSAPPQEEHAPSTVEAANNAHALLLELVRHYTNGSFAAGSEPPLIAFNGVISAWSRIRNTEKAEEVLWLMERTVRPLCTHLIPNAISYNSVLHGIYRQSQSDAAPSRKDVALQKALAIVSYMEQNSRTSQPDIRPNAFSYHTLLKCWLQSGSVKETATQEAEKLLGKVEQLWRDGDISLERTNRVYNMILNAYAKTFSGRRFLSTKALDLLARMKQSPHTECHPDIISYTSTLECIAQSSDPKAPDLADALLQEVKARYDSTKDANLRPNLRTYTMTIQTLARNNGNVARARELLTELVQQYESSGHDVQLKPNTFPYNYVLNCAANTMDPEKKVAAFQIATQTYQEMRHSRLIQPDSFSYAFWFKCCNNLLDTGSLRNKIIVYAFEECKRDGLVSNEVLTRLLQSSPKAIVHQLLQSNATTVLTLDEGAAAKNEIFTYQSLASQNKNRFTDPPNLVPGSNPPANGSGYRSVTIQDLPRSWSRNARAL